MSRRAGESVEANSVSFTYRGAARPALDDVSMRLEAGELAYLMGRTGAGKSTLCLCLNGVVPTMQPGEFFGEVRVGGESLRGRPVHEVAERVGMLFQDFEAQLLASDVEREVAFGLENAGVPRDEMRRRVTEALTLVGLQDLRGREPSTLSGGQKQRLALAAVLAPEPSVLVLDEPTTDLDPRAKLELTKVLAELCQRGVTMLVAEHETPDALGAQKLIGLSEGRKIVDGRPEALLRDLDACRRLGILPLQMPELFARLGLTDRPLTPEDAAEALTAHGLTLDEQRCRRLGASDTTAAGDPLIELEGVSFTYHNAQVPALREIDLTIHEGEFTVILGENGSGKSTLARHLNGLLSPTSGVVRIAGRDAREMSVVDRAREVGYLFQNPDQQIFATTVREEVGFGPRNLGLPEDTVNQRVARALEVTELAGWEDRDPFVLTRGERQRVALASVLACEPRVIVFDEPTTGLDGMQQRAMMDLLARLNAAGQTVVVITHCTWAAAEYARRAIVLDDGRLTADLSTRELFADDALLAQTGQVAPAITRLSRLMGGHTMLSVDEFAACVTDARGPRSGDER